jgi:peptidoglycan/xylan/chitin deacetylase (PgdA/CDA1 family)
MRTNVYLTVDTEHSMGGAWANPALRPVPTERHIFCRIDGKDHGIGWLCEELDRHKFRATFFAEMFGSLVFGRDDTRSWCQYLLERGQDVQLHTHLNFYYFAQQQSSPRAASARTDDLANVPSPLRAELLERACEMFRYATGYHPKAFRAGNWRADRSLISDLAKVGIRLDSSFNPATRAGGSFSGDAMKVNALQRVDGLWELPVSVVRQNLPEPNLANGLRPFDLVSLSSWEIRTSLDDANSARTPHVVAVLHSFSGVKAKDVQYRQMKPDRVVRHRLRTFLDHLAANRDRFSVSTCDELVSTLHEAQPGTDGAVPNLGFVHPLARKVVQAVNSIYWL